MQAIPITTRIGNAKEKSPPTIVITIIAGRNMQNRKNFATFQVTLNANPSTLPHNAKTKNKMNIVNIPVPPTYYCLNVL
jgi:hypothetical protein